MFQKRDRPPIRDPRWVRAGLILDRCGQLMLPLGLGAFLGYYAADRGMRLMPTLFELLTGWGAAALVFIVVGRWLRGRAYEDTLQGLRVRRRIVVALVLAVLGLGGRLAVWWTTLPSDLTELRPEQFDTAYQIDSQRYQEHARGMERLLGRMDAEGLPPEGDVTLTAEQERLLLDTWVAMHDYAVALDQIRVFYEDYFRYDVSRVERDYHLRAFLLTYAAELALYEKMARFSRRVLGNDNARKYLDAPHPDQALEAGTFSKLRQSLLGARDQARVVAGERYLEVLRVSFGARDEARRLGVGWLWSAVEAHQGQVRAHGLVDRAEDTVRADSQVLRRSVRRLWYPIQKEAAEVMGDTRVRRIGWYLIPESQQAEMDALLEPGDLMLSRKNWYVSNVGLPGFWPHAILYLGNPDKLQSYMDDPAVKAWVAEQSADPVTGAVSEDAPKTFLELLRSRHPEETLRYQLGDGDHDLVVMEAISEGVVLNTMAHAAGDYLAALRPRVDKVQKARAILNAFGHHGKPYDFDFDFATDHALVCTELVWRSYLPTGFVMPTKEMAGRQTLPANDIARAYAESTGRSERDFDFVAFIDASEQEQRTFFADEAAFIESWERSRWDTAAVRAPEGSAEPPGDE